MGFEIAKVFAPTTDSYKCILNCGRPSARLLLEVAIIIIIIIVQFPSIRYWWKRSASGKNEIKIATAAPHDFLRLNEQSFR